LRGIDSMSESIPQEESVPRNILLVAINVLKYHLRLQYLLPVLSVEKADVSGKVVFLRADVYLHRYLE
jgi:hypothetical protein